MGAVYPEISLLFKKRLVSPSTLQANDSMLGVMMKMDKTFDRKISGPGECSFNVYLYETMELIDMYTKVRDTNSDEKKNWPHYQHILLEGHFLFCAKMALLVRADATNTCELEKYARLLGDSFGLLGRHQQIAPVPVWSEVIKYYVASTLTVSEIACALLPAHFFGDCSWTPVATEFLPAMLALVAVVQALIASQLSRPVPEFSDRLTFSDPVLPNIILRVFDAVAPTHLPGLILNSVPGYEGIYKRVRGLQLFSVSLAVQLLKNTPSNVWSEPQLAARAVATCVLLLGSGTCSRDFENKHVVTSTPVLIDSKTSVLLANSSVNEPSEEVILEVSALLRGRQDSIAQLGLEHPWLLFHRTMLDPLLPTSLKDNSILTPFAKFLSVYFSDILVNVCTRLPPAEFSFASRLTALLYSPPKSRADPRGGFAHVECFLLRHVANFPVTSPVQTTSITPDEIISSGVSDLKPPGSANTWGLAGQETALTHVVWLLLRHIACHAEWSCVPDKSMFFSFTRHEFLDFLPPCAGEYHPNVLLSLVHVLQSVLCNFVPQTTVHHVLNVIQTYCPDNIDVRQSLELLCFPVLGKMGDMFKILLSHYPQAILAFVKTYYPSHVAHKQTWGRALHILLNAVECFSGKSDTKHSDSPATDPSESIWLRANIDLDLLCVPETTPGVDGVGVQLWCPEARYLQTVVDVLSHIATFLGWCIGSDVIVEGVVTS